MRIKERVDAFSAVPKLLLSKILSTRKIDEVKEYFEQLKEYLVISEENELKFEITKPDPKLEEINL